MSQGASNGGAQGAGNNRFVKFTRPAAQRIADAVRKVEGGNRDLGPVELGPRFASSSAKVFRMATFTGAWSINSAKTVTLRGSTSTLSATNPFLSLPENGSRACGVARDGTAWYLIQWQWDVADVLSNVSLGTAALQFSRVQVASLATATTVQISISTCSTAAT